MTSPHRYPIGTPVAVYPLAANGVVIQQLGHGMVRVQVDDETVHDLPVAALDALHSDGHH